MSDYSPLHKPGQAITRQASADITGGQVVYVSGDGTVAPTAGANAAWLGVAAHDAKNGENLTVVKGGVQRPTASGTVTAGDLVVSAAAGKVVTLGAVTTPTPGDVTGTRQIVGLALTTATDAPVEVDFAR